MSTRPQSELDCSPDSAAAFGPTGFPGLARGLFGFAGFQASQGLGGAAGFISAEKADVGDEFALDGGGGTAAEIDSQIGDGPRSEERRVGKECRSRGAQSRYRRIV